MQSFTVTQWVIIALVFVAGWLLGLASHGGGRKWRDRYAAEREAHAQTRKAADQRVAAADAKTAELDRENARLRAATPVTTQTVAPVRTVAARPAYAPGERRGWFDWGLRRV
jgi:hypothetical protein